MVIEEIKFINDIIQDTRADARIETKYELLINTMFKSMNLSWNKEGLRLESSDKLINLIEALEPERCENAYRLLLMKDEDKKKD